MGYLPIILAILGFIFLWAIVNYHSMRSRKAEASEAAELVYRYAALRQHIILQLANIQSDDPSLNTLIQRIKVSIQPISKEEAFPFRTLAAEQTLSRHIDELPDQLSTQKNYRNSIQQLQKADLAYRVAANRFTLKIKQYNDLVTKAPSKFVAALTGLKKIPTESSG